jgi:hypothetical protein
MEGDDSDSSCVIDVLSTEKRTVHGITDHAVLLAELGLVDTPEHREWLDHLRPNSMSTVKLTITTYSNGRKKTLLEEFGAMGTKVEHAKFADGSTLTKYLINHQFDRRDDKPAVVGLFPDGTLEFEGYYVFGRNHAEGKPAVREFYQNGATKKEKWYQCGVFFNGTDPASIEYNEDGSVKRRRWFTDGKLTRTEVL